MSAPNGSGARILELLGEGPATAIDLAKRMDTNAANVASSLGKLEGAKKVIRAGTRGTGGPRPAIIWRLPLGQCASIPASNSEEFVARGGRIEVLPGVGNEPPVLRRAFYGGLLGSL